MRLITKSARTRLLVGAAVGALVFSSGSAMAQSRDAINIEPQSLTSALQEFGSQTSRQVMFTPALIAAKTSAGVSGATDEQQALAQLLQGTGLAFRREGDIYMIVQAGEGGSSPQGASAGGYDNAVEALIVTAQKREENIQDVPIAISAFSMDDLDALKIEGGFDLLKAIPNVSFTKTNFTSYNFQIRGIGTQATSATTDPGVAVAFNNSGIIQNRLFEQEYLDLERVEVLRGPQGTLYGRNATAGVINVISAKPRMGEWEGDLKVEVGNYDTSRLRGMFNVPVGDTLAIRGAFAGTRRGGYVYNSNTENSIDGRELWSGRLSVGWEPDPRFRADLIWEHFEEDDDRLRTGKQLCHRDDRNLEGIGNTPYRVREGTPPGRTHPYPESFAVFDRLIQPMIFNQGCKPGSLYADEAFGTPNGLAYSFVMGPLLLLGAPISTEIGDNPNGGGLGDNGENVTIVEFRDPYGGKMQSRNLREIASPRDPVYRASADLFQLNIDVDLTDALTLSSQTLYNEDETYSFQDFNRFDTEPFFTDTSILTANGPNDNGPSKWANLAPGGVYCDPQVGCFDSLAGFDIAQASAEQFSQEIRLQSAFSGPLNFSVGANYTEFETLIDYYVMFNIISAMASINPFNSGGDGYYDQNICPYTDFFRTLPNTQGPSDSPNSTCPFIDPNPVDTSRNFGTGGNGEGDGHNYFRSKNPYELESWAIFSEVYWNIQDDLKLTAGLRYTDDTKTFTQVPSQVLLAPTFHFAGVVPAGYPVDGVIEQNWGEWTGRLVMDWQPELDFTDQTLVYGSFSRGYKGGGANPPLPDFASLEETYQQFLGEVGGFFPNEATAEAYFNALNGLGWLPVLFLTGVDYGPTFEPEFVNAFEVGTKNTLLDGGLTLNATAFYYDYTDYQVSQIRDRTAVNENFDAEMWGLELETVFSPTRDLQIIANIGYLKTRIADGEQSIDIMNRTQDNPDYTLVKPWVQQPSNCVVPTHVAESWVANRGSYLSWPQMCGSGVGGFLRQLGGGPPADPQFGGQPYDYTNYPEINGGAGFYTDLGGNELPNAPHWTMNIGAQYGIDVSGGWRATLRGDAYWQSQSYHRVYNFEPYDKLRAWYNLNLGVSLENPDSGVTVELYAKNVLDKSPITGAFLNSDDTGLTTNVFMLDPRLIGLSIRKEF